MTATVLGSALGGALPLAGGQAQLHERGLAIEGAGGAALVQFAFPQIGRPAMLSGDAAGPLLGPEAICFQPGGWEPGQLALLAAEALGGRLALLPTGQPAAAPVPLGLGPATALGGGRYGLAAGAAELAERQLYDVALLGDDGGWRRVAPHALYRRASWADFGIAHITDVHVARRIDRFRTLLAEAGRGEAAQRLVNWNDRFRGFVRYANYLHGVGVLDLILATGDLVDYLYEDDDDPAGGGNAAFLRELILGRAPGPEFPAVEELRVPICMVPGNHDYRRHAYKLLFDLHLGGAILGKDVARIKNFSGYHMLQADALLLANRLDGRDGDAVPNVGVDGAARMVEVDAEMTAYRELLAERDPYVVRLGPHRIVMLDTAHDVGMLTDVWDGLRQWLGTTSEDEATFAGGSPNSEGVSEQALRVVAEALAETPDEGLFIVGMHAPPFNTRGSEYPYFLRETQRPAQPGQLLGYLAHHGGAVGLQVEERLRERHPTWFAAARDHRAPRFVKRVDSQDMMDEGVARGQAEPLMRLLAGIDARRPADLVLVGHIHRHNEFRVQPGRDGELVYRMDFYTQNPGQYYPTPFTRDWSTRGGGAGRPPSAVPQRATTYVEVVPGAAADATPWPMPYAAMFPYQLQVPPYAAPLDSAADAGAWWAEHRPLVLQSGALGPMESSQVSFSGFRLLTVRGNRIDKIHFVGSEALEARQYQLPWEEAIRPAPPRRHRYLERSRPLGAPAAVGAPAAIVDAAQGARSLIYRDSTGQLHELWQRGGEAGAHNLTALASDAPRAASDPRLYIDSMDGTAVALYRGTDGHVHSIYWSPRGVGRDALSATAGAPRAAGIPTGYVGTDGHIHVIYRAGNGHLHELWWAGTNAPGHGDITRGASGPPAAGDPAAYADTRNGGNIVVYRGVDNQIHSLYWSDGPTGHDNLSGYIGSPLAAGDPIAYYTHHDDAHQVTYRSHDGHLHELWWNGANPVSHWDLSAISGAPPAASDPVGHYSPATNTKHVYYRSADGHLNEIWWVPGGGVPAHMDLSVYALAPLAADKPTAFALAGQGSEHLLYRGADEQLHEIWWI